MSTYSFVDGPGGLPVVKIANRWAEAEISCYGAQVLSFTPSGERPVLWVSKQSLYVHGKAIRGGIPVCWPWFGPHPSDRTQPAHGYARLLAWPLVAALELPDGRTQVSLELSPEAVRERVTFPRFEARLTVTVGQELEVALHLGNPEATPFVYSGALHSYFAVSDIAEVAVRGLDGVTYLDALSGASAVQHGDIRFDGEVDRVYLDTAATCEIVDRGWNRTIRVAKRGSRSTVVWNPWIDKAKRMSDFGDAEYREMLCVETTNAKSDSRTLAPGERAELTTVIGVLHS